MLSSLDRHNLAISCCGVPLTDDLLQICLSDPVSPRLEQAMIWLALLHGLDKLGPMLAMAPMPLKLTQNQAVGLHAALLLAGNPAHAGDPLHRLLATGVAEYPGAGSSTSWHAISAVGKLAETSPWAELIRQASLLHLSDPSALLADWLKSLDQSMAERMPFAALLRLSILYRYTEKLPKDWQQRLAETITAIGDVADSIPLYRFWMVVCQVAPEWDFACIRAADLALRFDDFSVASRLLERLERNDIQNVWFYDVKARCRYAYGDLRSAAHLWSLALSKVAPASPEWQVFRNRMQTALRGKFGLAEASRLTRSGKFEGALQLLRTLILNDPSFANHYKMLLSLQEVINNSERQREPDDQGPSVESVLDSYRSLWMGKENPIEAVKEPGNNLAELQQVAAFLDLCEQSLITRGRE
jgi:tetratricopeptide (TPR) repeat protein